MQCTEESFLNDIAGHTMTVLMDDEVYRHIKFSKGGSSVYRFDLITWPGTLCIHGDCGTYVFSRLCDMFEFFRREDSAQPEKLFVNRSYWAQKLDAIDKQGSVKEWSSKRFKERVNDYFEEHFEASDFMEEEAIRDKRRDDCLAAVESEVLYYADEEHLARQAINDFEFEGFVFQDSWEWDFMEYTHGFIWNLYAIAYGIREYDKSKELTNPAPAGA